MRARACLMLHRLNLHRKLNRLLSTSVLHIRIPLKINFLCSLNSLMSNTRHWQCWISQVFRRSCWFKKLINSSKPKELLQSRIVLSVEMAIFQTFLFPRSILIHAFCFVKDSGWQEDRVPSQLCHCQSVFSQQMQQEAFWYPRCRMSIMGSRCQQKYSCYPTCAF